LLEQIAIRSTDGAIAATHCAEVVEGNPATVETRHREIHAPTIPVFADVPQNVRELHRMAQCGGTLEHPRVADPVELREPLPDHSRHAVCVNAQLGHVA